MNAAKKIKNGKKMFSSFVKFGVSQCGASEIFTCRTAVVNKTQWFGPFGDGSYVNKYLPVQTGLNQQFSVSGLTEKVEWSSCLPVTVNSQMLRKATNQGHMNKHWFVKDTRSRLINTAHVQPSTRDEKEKGDGSLVGYFHHQHQKNVFFLNSECYWSSLF